MRDSAADGLAWGGESTVVLPARHGRGGRNTHLALAAARLLRPGEPLTILAAGTDGTDGPTDDAGAIVDTGTVGQSVYPTFKDVSTGAGLGIRYNPGFAPIRADVAFPINRRTGDAAFQLYLSIGQSF